MLSCAFPCVRADTLKKCIFSSLSHTEHVLWGGAHVGSCCLPASQMHQISMNCPVLFLSASVLSVLFSSQCHSDPSPSTVLFCLVSSVSRADFCYVLYELHWLWPFYCALLPCCTCTKCCTCISLWFSGHRFALSLLAPSSDSILWVLSLSLWVKVQVKCCSESHSSCYLGSN